MILRSVKYIALVCLTISGTITFAQQETDCDPTANLPITQGEVDFNYGSVTNAFSFRNRSSYTVAQSVVGNGVAKDFTGQSGFWSRFLLPPQAPQIQSSQGDFPDRVLINWNLDPLSSDASAGFVITRDGAFLAQVDRGIKQFIDFNVQAGEFYSYGVYGRNQFGNGTQGKSIGFVNPNGVVTGQVQTLSRNPVAGAVVTLSPSLGTSLSFDGVDDFLCVTHTAKIPTNMWTVSAWVKIGATHNSDGIVDLGSDLHKNFWIHTTSSGLGKGVVAGVGDGTSDHQLTHVFSTSPNDWHHVAAVYAGGTLLLYIDGSFTSSMQSTIVSEAALFSIGSRRNQTGFFNGLIDDVRIYNRPLSGTDVFLTKNITVSKNTPGLVAYWKFDEGVGTKVFDITDNNIDAYIKGPVFSNITPAIQNAGMTDVSGFYSIEGINYSKKQTFTAKPSKIFYSNYALEFNTAYQAYAKLTDFDLPDTSTIEITVHPFDLQSRQTLLSNGNSNFELWIQSGQYRLTINGQTQILGPAATSYQHLTLVLNGVTNQVGFYKNGVPAGTFGFSSLAGNWSGSPWQMGARNAIPTDFYTGLIDEVAFYKSILPLSDIQLHASLVGNGGTNVGHPHLMSYFSLNEGTDSMLEDSGPAMTGFGQMYNAFFSIITYKQKESPHLFRPSERLVNVNPSNTAASGIDFIDESTLTVSGVVRFSNTFCYQDSVEILVDGKSAFPPVYTNTNGEFVADFEPGVNVRLTPKFGDHKFSPPFYQVQRLNRPIAGVLFQNLTKRSISGEMAGGLCRQSIIPDDGVSFAVVKVEALNLCFSKVDTLRHATSKFNITGLPPIPVSVKVIRHTNPVISMFLGDQGGTEVDLRLVEKDTVDFIYIAPPQVYIKPFEVNGCVGSGLKLIEQASPKNNYKEYNTNIRVYEEYDGGLCYLDSFKLIIENEIGDLAAKTVFVKDTSTYQYKFWAGQPNLGYPHQKFLQVTAEVNGSLATKVETVIVLGERSRESTFTTSTPSMPLIILRDPPGDGSSAVLSEGTTNCQTWSNATLVNVETQTALNLDIGPKIVTWTGFLAGTIIESSFTNQLDFSTTTSAKIGTESATEVCLTNDIEYSTSSDDAVIGGDADVYVGAAINFEFSATDVLSYDPLNCSGTSVSNFPITQNVRVNPKSFGTKYHYSEWQIKTDVIPSNEFIGDTVSANAWRKILEYNKELKKNAVFKKNLSFDALVNYKETQTTSSAGSFNFNYEFGVTTEMNEAIGFEIAGVGSVLKFSLKMGASNATTIGSSNTKNRSVSYTLADNDVSDNFTVDVLDDPVFGTPVFKLKAGESMCPWEPGTQNREEVSMSIDRLTAVNVPANEPAVFKVKLTNAGQTGNDALVYILGKVPGGNPDAAYMQLDGAEFGEPLAVQLGPFQTKSYIISVYKGPEKYSYRDIGIFMASACQWDHSRNLGYDLTGAYSSPGTPTQGQYKTSDLYKFYKEYRLNVEFLEPCSPIDIGFPMQDWVITPAQNENLSIQINNYINNDPDLNFVRVQYRRTGGDGAWINIDSLSKADLASSPVFKLVNWDMTELADGPYEIRAITQCFDVGLPPGNSVVIKGRKETKPPKLYGLPQPADGVLSPGDEISISYTKRIDCTQIFQADGIGTNINLNNIALLDMTNGGILIKATIACKDEKIVIIPDIANQFIENHVLRAVATNIKDLYGNPAQQTLWEFYVNRSNLFWHGGDIDEVVIVGNEMIVTREIRNQSGQQTSFTIGDIPDWMDIFPTAGSLAPGAIQLVRFIFPADLVTGFYNTTIQMKSVDGEEPIKVDLRVACPSPDWIINPAEYSFSMNLTLQLNIEGTLSNDKLDKVGAFIDGKLRGIGKVQYSRVLNKYLVFLTVYSNLPVGETVTFQIWDASACLLYGSTIETFPFVADGLIGSPLVPQVIYTNSQLLRKIYIHPGWNWISYNINLTTPAINSALNSVTNPAGALIKGQTEFSVYSSLLNTWLGGLENLSHLTMYQYNALSYDSISLIGAPVDPTTSRALVAGWNWISYLPQSGYSVTKALSSLQPLNGDIIKGQVSFAQYVSGVGWVGNLNFMSFPNGYLIKLSTPGILSYPAQGSPFNGDNPGLAGKIPSAFADNSKTYLDNTKIHEQPYSYWSVSPQNFEFSMNAIAVVVKSSGSNVLADGDEVGVFAGNELRGSSKAIFIPALDAYMVFLTIYANKEGELLKFKMYDASEVKVIELAETTAFRINAVWGQADAPQPLHFESVTGTKDVFTGDHHMVVYPNPAGYYVYINYTAEINDKIDLVITDVSGRQMFKIKGDVQQGQNVIEWKPESNVPNGLYNVTLKSAKGVYTRKVELVR